MDTFTCGFCGREFERRGPTGRLPTYCSSHCRVYAYNARLRIAAAEKAHLEAAQAAAGER